MYGPTHYKFSIAIALGGISLLDIFDGTGIIWQATPLPLQALPVSWLSTAGDIAGGHDFNIPGYHFSLGAHFHILLFVSLIAVSFVSGLLPDVDCEHGTLGNLPEKFIALDQHIMKRHFILLVISLFFLHILDFILDLHFHLIRVLSGGHRHATHWLVTSLIWAFFLEIIFVVTKHLDWWPIAFAAWIAYLAHLGSDALTLAGIPAFGPVDRNRYHLWPRPFWVRAGGYFDSLLGNVSLFFDLVVGFIPIWLALHRI